MASTTPTEFPSFPKLPPELREMVWDEAFQIPTLDIQRFNAEIALHPDSPKMSCEARDLVLCLNPNDDFVQLTSGLVGLLRACRESRWAASANIKGYLPINYIARDIGDSFVVRFARVPFNPDGRLCISGLGPAFNNATKGYGARGILLPSYYYPHGLTGTIQCPTFSEIKNLTITLDMPGDFEHLHLFLLGWNDRLFDNMAKRMHKLETVALVDEGVLNERHHIDVKEFEGLHKPAPVVRTRGENNGDKPSTAKVPWQQLYDDFTSNLFRFNALKEFRAGPVDARAS